MEKLYKEIPSQLPEELVSILVENEQVRIERIVSTGHRSPDDFWYDQDEHEWVVVLKGEATLLIQDEDPVAMKPGDHLLIPAHKRHRVESTSPEEPTVWLAVSFETEAI